MRVIERQAAAVPAAELPAKRLPRRVVEEPAGEAPLTRVGVIDRDGQRLTAIGSE